MKKTLLLLIVLFAFGCKTEIEPQDSLKVFDKNSLSETSQMFIPLAEVAWDFMKDGNSRNAVYKEVDKQFDGDNNVLFKTLITDESSPLGRVANSETIEKAKAALVVFKTVDEAGPVYPQIYIPFYEELKEAGKIGIQNPVIIFRDGPPTKDEKYQGYSFRNGELMDKGMISEDFASKNEVWVISINERVDLNGEVKEGFNSSFKSGRIQGGLPAQIKGVTIYGKNNLKEDWIGGGAEVSLSPRILYDGTNTNITAYFTDNELRAPQVDAVVDVKRSDASNHTWKWADFRFLVKDWDTNPNFYGKLYAVYILFEFDPWPAGIHTSSYNGISTSYQSYESPWYMGQAYRPSINGYNINNNEIYFKMYEF